MKPTGAHLRGIALSIAAFLVLVMPEGATKAFAGPFASKPLWVQIGPTGGNVGSGKLNAFAFVQSNPNIMFTGGGWGNTPRESPSQSGVYRTMDGGVHWTAVNAGLTNPDGTISSVVNGLWLDQSDPSIVLASTEFGGTFRSTDGGTTWHNVDLSESTQFAQVGTLLYLATRRGVLVSADDGATWSVSLAVTNGASTVVSASGATYAGTADGNVFRLKAGVWTMTGHVGTGPVHNLAVDPFNAKIVYANVDDQSAWNQDLYGSIDGGKTWTFINCPCSIGAQAIAFSLVVPNRMYLGDDGGGAIYYFTANGNPNPVIQYGAQPYGVDMRYIVPAAGPSKTDDACYLLEDQGLFYAAHCTSGTAPPLNNNVADTLAYDVKVTAGGKSLIAPLQDNSAVESLNGGKSWNYDNNAAGAGEGGEAAINPLDPTRCYFAHPDVGLYISSNSCSSFAGPYTSGFESLTFDPASSTTLYGVVNVDTSAAAVAVSTNGGTVWNNTPWHFTNPYQVAMSPVDAKTIVVATGTATSTPHLDYTHDGGTTWHKSAGLPNTVSPNQGTQWFPVHRFFAAFEPGVAGTLLLIDHDPSTDNILVYKSVDNAQTFSHVMTFVQPVPSRPWPHLLFPTSDERVVRSARYYATRFFGNRIAFNEGAVPPTIPAVVVTTRFGAFVSYDVGVHWMRIDTKAIAHHFVGADWNGGYLYLASFGEGVIRTSKPLQ
jgi:hypothetical protein